MVIDLLDAYKEEKGTEDVEMGEAYTTKPEEGHIHV